MVLALALACAMGCTALADGGGESYSSRLRGWGQFAQYVGDYDGYEMVDGLGGASDADTVTVISKSASVWEQPRTNSGKIGSAKHGERIRTVSGDGAANALNESGFYAVQYKNRQGWINAAYVVRNALTITLMESNVPAFIAPDRTSKKVGSLAKQTSYRVVGFYDDFYIVNLRDAAVAYIPMSVRHYDNCFSEGYRKPVGSLTVQSRTSLRTGPGSRYAEIRKLNAGTQMDVYDMIDGFYLVEDEKGNSFAFVDAGDATDNVNWP